MFNFLNSTVLFAAAAALIPLVIHLFSKRRVKTVEFSSIRHLKAMQRQQVRRLKVRQLLLLLLRMLIILLIVIAFARPTTEKGTIGSHASVSAIILIDNSASMNREVADGNLFVIAREQAKKLLNTFGEADELSLLTTSPLNPGDRVSFTSVSGVASQIANLKPSSELHTLDEPLSKAVALLNEASNLNKEIYLITDRQRVALPDTTILANSDAQVYIINLDVSDYGNIGVSKIDLGGQLLLPGHPFDINTVIKNYSGRNRDDLIASLFIDGHRVSQSSVAVSAGGEKQIRFNYTLQSGGHHYGAIELSDDRYLTDNTCYFSFHIPDQFNVLIIGENVEAEYLSLALSPSSTINQYWSIKRAHTNDLSKINLGEYDVIVIAGQPEIEEVYAKRIQSYVQRGTPLFFVYSGRGSVDNFNSVWSPVCGFTFKEKLNESFSRSGFYSLKSAQAKHPIFSIFDLVESKLPEIKFYTLARVSPSETASVLARFTGDHPALIESAYGQGKVISFLGPISPKYSDLSSNAFFVPFSIRILEYLSARLSSYDLALTTGSIITRPVHSSTALTGSIEMLAPDSSLYLLTPTEYKGEVSVTATPIKQPGIYKLKYLSILLDQFAVNTDAREGDLTPVDIKQFATAIGSDDFVSLELGSDYTVAVSENRHGKELWQLFLWLAGFLMLTEMIISRGKPAEDETQ